MILWWFLFFRRRQFRHGLEVESLVEMKTIGGCYECANFVFVFWVFLRSYFFPLFFW